MGQNFSDQNNGIYKCPDNQYLASVYDVNKKKTVFLGKYPNYIGAEKKLEEYTRKHKIKIPKCYCTY